ncbi:MAG: DUF1887 family CARF protein [Gallionella sp.]|nr:DUF1887 family protein [Gallionella sp.]
MNNYDTHVCIVSNEPLPNYIPAISKEIGRNKIVLLESPAMKSKADSLEFAFKSKQYSVVRFLIDDKGNLSLFRKQIQQVLADHPSAALNATGGMKIMSLIAHEVFRVADRPIFYSERDNRIIWLNPIDQPQQRVPGVLSIEDYFAAFGQPLLRLNHKPLESDGGEIMLTKLYTIPKAEQGDHNRIGERFESLVFRAAKNALNQLKVAGVQDIAWGVKTGGETPDEFDVVIVRNNIMYLIECKNANSADGFNNFINKLDALKRKRGLTARAAIITTTHISKHGTNAKRAEDSNIKLWDDTDLPDLTEKIKMWLYV